MEMASSLLIKCKIRQRQFFVKIGETLHTMVMFIGIKAICFLVGQKKYKKGMSICVGKTSFL